MTMRTEAEARKCFCPFAREEVLSGPPFNGQPRCIASECMAWRWGSVSRWDNSPGGSVEKVVRSDDGFCGLAGKP